MSAIKDTWTKEPAVVVSTVSSLIALVVAFGLSLTTEQVGALLAAIISVGGLLTRSQVSSTAALAQYVADHPAESPAPPAG